MAMVVNYECIENLKRFFILVLISFNTLSCNLLNSEYSRNELPPTTPSVFIKKYRVDGTNIRGRMIYIHYINGNADLMDEGYFGDIKRGFLAKGFQVISLNCPLVDQNSFNDGGSSYLKNYFKLSRLGH